MAFRLFLPGFSLRAHRFFRSIVEMIDTANYFHSIVAMIDTAN
jgi:hypothetical protein